MRPGRSECRDTSLSNTITGRVFDGSRVRASLLNIHYDRPATVRRVLEVFCDWIVLLLPSIQCAIAVETCCVVGVCFVGFVVEACMRQLKNLVVSMGRYIFGGSRSYLSW